MSKSASDNPSAPGDPWAARPKPPVLKRFANLEIDGVEAPPREKPQPRTETPRSQVQRSLSPAPRQTTPTANRPPTGAQPNANRPPTGAQPNANRPPTGAQPNARAEAPLRDPDLQALAEMAEHLNDNARTTRASLTPEARRAQRAEELRRLRPPDPPPRSREPTPSELAARREFNARREQDRIRFDLRQVQPADLDLELPDLRMMATPGVMTMEVDLRARRGPPPAITSQAAPRTRQTPLELTAQAARQVQLMAWEAGVPGSGLRILTSMSPGMTRPELDFAFDDHLEPDDVVFECLGVTIIVDPATLRHVAGRRITWLDIPGSEGFAVR
jgi:Fe-S cluster assembly iron-binding protein IscA